MKSVLIATSWLAISLIARAQEAPDRTGPVGRYQFVVANVFIDGTKTETLFRIDTATGAASRLIGSGISIPESKRPNPQIKSYSAEGWLPIPESYAAEVQRGIDEVGKMLPRNQRTDEKKP